MTIRWQLLGERRAISLLLLGFATSLFVMVGLAAGGAWSRCFLALAAVYGVGFFGLAAEWFWARWYAMGISGSGITMAVLGLVTSGWNPGIAIWGGIHLLIYAPLLGEAMAARYEDRPEWRQRYGLDDYGVARLKRAVKGAATGLPTLVFYALAPRGAHGIEGVALLLLAGLGFWGLIRMRFWGVMLLGAATVWSAVAVSTELASVSAAVPLWGMRLGLTSVGLIAVVALAVAVSPFVVPAYRFLRRPEQP